jgi:hypothetical protein
MIGESTNQFENLQNENNEKNRIKLFLEASLRKKVDNFNIYMHKERKELQRSEISYKVWLYSHDIIKDARNALNRNNEYGNPIKQKQEVIKFKLGLIDFEELKEQNQIFYSKNNIMKNEKEYYAVLAQVYVGKMQTHLMEEGGDVDKAVAEISKFTTTEKSDCYYLCRNYSEVKYNHNCDHWFALRDNTKMVYLALVKFSTDEELIFCSGCNENKLEMKYCHNDKKYFCSSCDDDFHNKTSYQTLRKHRRTNYISFSVTYQGTCSTHTLKPYEFYCSTCKAIYCIRCITDGDHANNSEHDVRYLSELSSSVEQESKSLNERVKQINSIILSEMDEKEKNSREIQRVIQSYENDLYERKRKALVSLESETLARCTYLASLSIELQRLSSEIESKASFIRNQYVNADNATYINMTNIFNKYMKDDLFHNVDMLVNLNLENITQPFHKIEQKERSEINEKKQQK